MNTFIISDKVVSTLHLRLQHHTADERVLHWTRTVLMLEMNPFWGGDKQFTAGHDRIENMHLNFSHTHTHTHS